MPKITFVGAGSTVFATKLVVDILSFDELADSELALMNIDEHRLEQTTKCVILSGRRLKSAVSFRRMAGYRRSTR